MQVLNILRYYNYIYFNLLFTMIIISSVCCIFREFLANLLLVALLSSRQNDEIFPTSKEF